MTTETRKISIEDLKKGYKKRHRTFITFTCQNICLGMEYALTFVTLWLYLEETLKASNLKLFYGLISAVYVTTQIVISILIGYIFDKYRNTSSMFLNGNCLIVIGNAIYAIPYSPWYLFLGRIISGAGGYHRPIISSDLARSYPADKISSKFSIVGMAFALGFVIGPGTNFMFVKADFFIGWLHITYTNAPACCLAVIFILNQILVTCLVSDLSKEYDLKEQETVGEEIGECTAVNNSDDESNELLPTNKYKDENRSRVHVFNQLLRHTDTLIVLLFSYVLMYCMVSFDLWQPLANVKQMHWGVLEINVIVFGSGITSVVALLFITYRPLSNHSIVYMSWICTLFLTLILIMYTVLAVCNSNRILNIVCWTYYSILFAILVIFDEVFLIVAMAKMTSSRVQTLTESIRLAFSQAGALTALLTAAISFTQLDVRVIKNEKFLHRIKSYEFINSPELIKSTQSGGALLIPYEVTIISDGCVVISWRRNQLRNALRKGAFLKNIFDLLIGQDVAKKLFNTSQMVANSGGIPNQFYNLSDDVSRRSYSRIYDANVTDSEIQVNGKYVNADCNQNDDGITVPCFTEAKSTYVCTFVYDELKNELELDLSKKIVFLVCDAFANKLYIFLFHFSNPHISVPNDQL